LRLIFVSNGPLPYHTPIINALTQLVDVHVLYMSRFDPIAAFGDTWGVSPKFDHSFFWSITLKSSRSDFRAQVSAGVSIPVARLRPDVVLFISWHPLVIEPLLWTRLFRQGSVMWSESTVYSGILRGGISTRIRRAVVGATDSFVTNGTAASEYLVALGAEPSRIVTSRRPSGVRHSTTTSRTRRSVPAPPHFLFVGRLIERKRPLDLIDSFERLMGDLPDATLSLVGNGPLESAAQARASQSGGRVRVLGRLEGDELSAAFASADVLVVPSKREVWGLVVNEALAHGLYILATDEVAGAADLLDASSGTIVPADDLAAFGDAMVRCAREVDFSDAARGRRRRALAEFTPERFAEDIHRAAVLAETTTRRRRGR
jgi:glycosyltransferase involved in cell wall biosynthesis